MAGLIDGLIIGAANLVWAVVSFPFNMISSGSSPSSSSKESQKPEPMQQAPPSPHPKVHQPKTQHAAQSQSQQSTKQVNNTQKPSSTPAAPTPKIPTPPPLQQQSTITASAPPQVQQNNTMNAVVDLTLKVIDQKGRIDAMQQKLDKVDQQLQQLQQPSIQAPKIDLVNLIVTAVQKIDEKILTPLLGATQPAIDKPKEIKFVNNATKELYEAIAKPGADPQALAFEVRNAAKNGAVLNSKMGFHAWKNKQYDAVIAMQEIHVERMENKAKADPKFKNSDEYKVVINRAMNALESLDKVNLGAGEKTAKSELYNKCVANGGMTDVGARMSFLHKNTEIIKLSEILADKNKNSVILNFQDKGKALSPAQQTALVAQLNKDYGGRMGDFSKWNKDHSDTYHPTFTAEKGKIVVKMTGAGVPGSDVMKGTFTDLANQISKDFLGGDLKFDVNKRPPVGIIQRIFNKEKIAPAVPDTKNMNLSDFRVSSSLRTTRVYLDMKDKDASGKEVKPSAEMKGQLLAELKEKYKDTDAKFGMNKNGDIYMGLKSESVKKIDSSISPQEKTIKKFEMLSAAMNKVKADFPGEGSKIDLGQKISDAATKINVKKIRVHMDKKTGELNVKSLKGNGKVNLNDNQKAALIAKLETKFGKEAGFTFKDTVVKNKDGSDKLDSKGKPKTVTTLAIKDDPNKDSRDNFVAKSRLMGKVDKYLEKKSGQLAEKEEKKAAEHHKSPSLSKH